MTNQADWTLNFCKGEQSRKHKSEHVKINKNKVREKTDTHQLSIVDTGIHIGGEAAWRDT